MASLRNKIVTSYGLSKVALLIFVAVVIADLHYLQTQIVEGEVVNQLYVSIQEIRRDEKNLFLYKSIEDFQQLQQDLAKVQDIFTASRQIFTELASPAELAEIDAALRHYGELFSDYLSLSASSRLSQQEQIRASGHDLSELAGDLYQRQRAILSGTTRVAVWTLMAASITVILLGFISAFYLVRRVVRPLRQLEEQLDRVADGQERSLALQTNEKEIQSFVHHFNSMLEELNRQQHKLRQHEKAAALGVLVSGVAHELNNPLSNISTSVQLLMEDDDNTREDLRKQWLSHIDGECERARRIVRRLLDSVRQPTHHERLIKASELVQSAVLLIHRQLPEFLFHIEDISDSEISVDRERMQQVFINLIKNANDAGALNLWITGSRTTWKDSRPSDRNTLVGDPTELRQSEHVLLFRVEDDGPGIPADHLGKLFDPFFTTHTGGEGTGLGLYLVEEIVSEHSGCISVENRTEGGSRFTIWLPAPDIHAQQMDQEAT
jgi:signal transduction histidine kinase